MDIVKEANFKTKFNQVEHEVEIYLDSSAGESDSTNYKYPINPNGIVNLNIEDTVADWIVRGSLTFFYNPEAGPKIVNPATGNTSKATTNINSERSKPFYNFRNDGYDLLRIRIKPNLKDSNLPDTFKISNNVLWTLSYLFSIYDAEDVDLPPGAQNQASASIKCLKIFFWDVWYQKMITNTLQYSTALSQRAELDPQYNNLGVLPTGQAMKEIIDLSLSQNSSQQGYTDLVIPDPVLKINYQPTAESSEEWDQGEAKIFYTTPANTTAYESLMYIYDKHVSTEKISLPPKVSAPRGGTKGDSINDFDILIKERGPTENDTGYLSLKSVSSYFQKAGNAATIPGEYQMEHFFLQGYTDTKKSPTKTLRAPIGADDSDTIDFKSLKYGTISNYRFVDISALTNSTSFVNSPVYSFDFTNRKFNIEFEKNSAQTAREFIQKKYINELYKNNRATADKLFLINLNKDKEAKNTKPVFSLYGDNPVIRQHAGLQKLLYVGLFQNAAINFRTLGLTSRETGRFIAIDRTEGVEPGDFEDKFYGQWFVINVKHIIETEFYYNDITAIKIHRFQPLNNPFLGII